MDNTLIRQAKSAYRDTYNFLEKHLQRLEIPEHEFWALASQDYSTIWNLHPNDDILTQDLLTAAYAELERRWKCVHR